MTKTEDLLYFRLEPHEREIHGGLARFSFAESVRRIPGCDYNPLLLEWSVPIVYALTVETKRQIYLTDEKQQGLF